MLKNKIKSLLKSKSNIIYIIVFVVIFAVFGISINIVNFVDEYYDKVIDNSIEEVLEGAEETDNITVEKVKETYRTIQVSGTLPEYEKNKIRNMKHVENIKQEKNDSITYIIVDDWRNCKYVESYLNKQGIEHDFSYGDDYNIEIYKKIRSLSSLICYLDIAITVIILFICCDNIIKNEQKNTKLLNIIGYNSGDIKKITFMQLITIVGIGLLIGVVISKIGIYMLSNTQGIVIKEDIIKNLIITLLVILIPILQKTIKAGKLLQK